MSCIDVIVPCYRYGHFLRECVGSVLAQSFRDVRVLIIDDASPDNTFEVGAALAAEDPRVEVMRHPVNRGHIATYNEGIDWVAAKYMLILSADDFLLPGALQRAISFLDAHEDVGFVHGRWIDYKTGDPVIVPPPIAGEPPWHLLEGIEFIHANIPVNRVATATAVVRTELQKRLGGYRQDLPHAGDLEMWLRFAVHARVGALTSYQAAYRRHTANMSIGYYAPVIPDIEQRKAAFASILDRFGDRIPGSAEIETKVAHALAEEALRWAHFAFRMGDERICLSCLNYAATLSPEICSSPLWSRLIWKRRIGRTVFSLFYAALQRIAHRSPRLGDGSERKLM